MNSILSHFRSGSRRHVLALGLILAVAVILRVLWLLHININPDAGRFDDTVFYYDVAGSLARGGVYNNPWTGHASAQWPPGYPAVLALAFLPFGKSLLMAKAFNVCLALAAIVLTYVLASRLFNPRVGLVAAFLLAIFPSYIYLSTLVLSENLFVPALLLVVVLLAEWGVRGLSPPTWRQSVVLGAAIGFTSLVRVEGIWLLAPAALVLFFSSGGLSRALKNVLLVAVGVGLLLAPWTVRNAVELHSFVPIRSGTSRAIAHSLAPNYQDYFVSAGQSSPTLTHELRLYLRHPRLAIDLVRGKVHDFYEDDQALVPWFLGVTPPQARSDQGVVPWRIGFVGSERPGAQRWSDIANAVYFGIGAAALAGLILSVLARQGRALFLAAVVATWTLGFAVATPSTRYHIVLLPLIAIFASLALVRLLPKAVNRASLSRRQDLLVGSVALASGVALALLTISRGYGTWGDSIWMGPPAAPTLAEQEHALGFWLDSAVPQGYTVGTYGLGSLASYTHADTVDLASYDSESVLGGMMPAIIIPDAAEPGPITEQEWRRRAAEQRTLLASLGAASLTPRDQLFADPSLWSNYQARSLLINRLWFTVLLRNDVAAGIESRARGLLGGQDYFAVQQGGVGWRGWHGTLEPLQDGYTVSSSEVAYSVYRDVSASVAGALPGDEYVGVVWARGTTRSAGERVTIILRERGGGSPPSETQVSYTLSSDWLPLWVARSVQQPGRRDISVHVLKVNYYGDEDAFLVRGMELQRLDAGGS